MIRCQPEQEIFNRFLKVKYWEVFRNESLIATVAHSSKSIYYQFVFKWFSVIWFKYIVGFKTTLDVFDCVEDRFSVINATRYPELHIRDVSESDITELRVRCVLQSIVDESREIRPQEMGKLQSFGFFFQYEEVRSQSTDVDVVVVSLGIFNIFIFNDKAGESFMTFNRGETPKTHRKEKIVQFYHLKES